MKVRVAYTVEVTDEFRRAIRRYHGKGGIATREEVKHWFELWGGTMNDDLLAESGDAE